jgi:ketosteroid isomerase-like protein
MATNLQIVAKWLDAYGQAWMSRDAVAAAALYTQNATYQVTPFTQPLRGRDAIFEYWKGVVETEEEIQFDYEILATTGELAIARWWASFVRVPPGLATKLDGIFLLSVDAHGRCKSLREWWVKQQG